MADQNMTIEQQARLLAKENCEAEPGITKIYWFPDADEVRLVELDANAAPTGSGSIEPFYFRASPEDDLPFPSGVALIHPDDQGTLQPPAGWGDWSDATEIGVER